MRKLKSKNVYARVGSLLQYTDLMTGQFMIGTVTKWNYKAKYDWSLSWQQSHHKLFHAGLGKRHDGQKPITRNKDFYRAFDIFWQSTSELETATHVQVVKGPQWKLLKY